MFRRALLSVVLLVVPGALLAQAPAGLQEGPLTAAPNPDVTAHPRTPDDSTMNNDAIIRMTKAGLSEPIIAQAVQSQPGRYDTGAEDLIALKQAGVDERVISLILAHGTGLTVRSSPAGASTGTGRAKPVNVTALSAALDEMGVYYQDKTGDWTPLKTEKVTIKSGGWIKNAVTDGLVKQDRNGTVSGEHSPLILTGGTPLAIFAPEGTSADEYEFVQFREHGNRREFRVYTGGVFHGGGGSDRDTIEFKAQKVGPRMYTFSVPDDITIGEYGILPPGSAAGSPSLNGSGKMFTFSVAESNAPKKP